MNDCLFCKIINKKTDSLVLYEDEKVIVILDAFPDCDGHSLVIPKKHYEDITMVDDEMLIYMINIAKKFGNIIMQKLNAKSITYLINYGDSQKIKHLHLHILPNYPNKSTMTKDEVYKILKGE